MTQKLLSAFFLTALLLIGGAAAAAAQELAGTYYYDTKIDEGRHDFRILFELRPDRKAFYLNEQNGERTQRRAGSWRWNQKTGLVTIVLPPVTDNPMQGQEVRLTFVLKFAGGRLKMVRSAPYDDQPGAVFRRL